MKNKFKVLCGAVALAMAGQVSAVTSFTVGGVTPTLTGWADTDSGKLESQPLSWYSGGYGITNKDAGTTNGDPLEGNEPEHALDNNDRLEMVGLDFGTSNVNLTGVSFGWTGFNKTYSGYSGVTWDSDFTLLAYTGASAANLKGRTWTDIANDSAWAKIGSYSNAPTGSNISIANTVFSSYWLIGPYNPLGGDTSKGWTTGNDAVKLASVIGTVCASGTGPSCTPPGKVPEPSSLALFGLGLLGMIGFRRRQPIRI